MPRGIIVLFFMRMRLGNWRNSIAQTKNALGSFFSFLWSHNHEILFALIFGVALLLRVYAFQERHYFYNGDYNRDYLVAHHIVAYHEFPLTMESGGFRMNSPAYFYFLTIPLLVKDSIISLGLFNVFLQLGALALVYMLGRALFGKLVGVMAFALFAVNENIVYQSRFVWQPYVMQPFILLSILLLYQSYARRSFRFLIGSIAAFLFAATLHQSVWALAPAYIFIAIMILYSQRRSLWHYAGSLAATFGIFILLYAPLIFYLSRQTVFTSQFSQGFSTFTVADKEFFSKSFVAQTQLLSKVFFLRGAYREEPIKNHTLQASLFSGGLFIRNIPSFAYNAILICMFVVLTMLYTHYAPRERKKKYVLLLLYIACASFITVTAFIPSDRFYYPLSYAALWHCYHLYC